MAIRRGVVHHLAPYDGRQNLALEGDAVQGGVLAAGREAIGVDDPAGIWVEDGNVCRCALTQSAEVGPAQEARRRGAYKGDTPRDRSLGGCRWRKAERSWAGARLTPATKHERQVHRVYFAIACMMM